MKSRRGEIKVNVGVISEMIGALPRNAGALGLRSRLSTHMRDMVRDTSQVLVCDPIRYTAYACIEKDQEVS